MRQEIEPCPGRVAGGHLWRVEPPNGPTSPGRCVHCMAIRDFANSEDTATWNNRRKSNNGAALGGAAMQAKALAKRGGL